MNKLAVDQLQDTSKSKPRKLIVCIDGTSNQFSEKVFSYRRIASQLYSRIEKDETQLTYYNSGVGTYARPFWWSFAYQKQQILNQIDLAIAWKVAQSTDQSFQQLTQFNRNFEKVILGAYRWLADTYKPGDQIFLFGWTHLSRQPGADPIEDPSAAQFKEAFCRQKVSLYFVGVWDTVASVGIFPRKPFPLTDKCKHITHFRHALALDELRVKFLPEHINDDCALDGRTLEEVWFAGTHSDIGGGNKANPTLDRGGEPLKWMMEEAHDCGLSVRLDDVKIGMPHAKVTNSMIWKWLILEILPLSWKRYRPNGDSKVSRGFHLMTPREVLPRHSIHWTVGASLKQGNRSSEILQKPYAPKAIPIDKDGNKVRWKTMELNHQKEGLPKWADNHNFIRMIEILKNEPESVNSDWFSNLHRHVLWNDQRQYGRMGDHSFFRDCAQIIQKNRKPLDPKTSWNAATTAPKPGVRITTDNQVSAERLRNMVIPRICLLLTQWTEDLPAPQPEPPKSSPWSWVLNLLGFQSTDTSNTNSVDAQWNLIWLPKEERSILLAHTVVDLILDIANTKHVEVVEEASAKLATVIGRVMNYLTITNCLIRSAASWGKEKAASKELFYMDGIGSKLAPLICAKKVYPNLALQAMHAVALDQTMPEQVRFDLAVVLVVAGSYSLHKFTSPPNSLLADFCGRDIADSPVIHNLLDVLRGDYEIKEIGINIVRAITLSTKPPLTCFGPAGCGMELSGNDAFDTLFDILEGKGHVDGILYILKNLAPICELRGINTGFVQPNDPERQCHINTCRHRKPTYVNAGCVLALAQLRVSALGNFDKEYFEAYKEKGVVRTSLELLNTPHEAQIIAAARLLRSLINGEASLEKPISESAERYVDLSEVAQSLFASLQVQFRSQKAINELLATAVRIAFQESISDDDLSVLTSLAVAGNKGACLPVLVASLNIETRRENIENYVPVLVDLIAPENEQLLQDSLEVLIALVEKGKDDCKRKHIPVIDSVVLGYLLPTTYIGRLLDGLVSIVLSGYAGAFGDSGKLSWWVQKAIVVAAFRSVKALSVDSTARSYIATTGLLESVMLETRKHTYDNESEEAMLNHLCQYGKSVSLGPIVYNQV
ncbi:hypothetical protein AG1IA_07948 [Rhizoctonia solani AG-1 IA]|uniref:T6SS Phospholipase effector Tle1-like catalytic domain-containing protein n=1 Tax=Thanatephorus cucumeris (strain AG1-IA) TaxID=983506 RepID=L8WMK4_THACA|nr:hypothetical protein AG1IA_07948 [Rhizoctonia solani AG-1 IA]